MPLFQALISLLFPPCCVNCGSTAGWLCFPCQTIWRSELLTEVTVYRLPQLDVLVAVQDASILLSKLLFAWKYQRYLGARHILQELWAHSFVKSIATTEAVTLVPIPMHRFKLWQRGFNQAEELAQFTSDAWSVTKANLLKRIRYTSTQVGLSKIARQKNLQSAFAVDPCVSKLVNKDNLIVLVDDIVTSGTTLLECAQVLRLAGFHHIVALVLHRGTRAAL